MLQAQCSIPKTHFSFASRVLECWMTRERWNEIAGITPAQKWMLTTSRWRSRASRSRELARVPLSCSSLIREVTRVAHPWCSVFHPRGDARMHRARHGRIDLISPSCFFNYVACINRRVCATSVSFSSRYFVTLHDAALSLKRNLRKLKTEFFGVPRAEREAETQERWPIRFALGE